MSHDAEHLELVELVGAGGHGEVWVVRDRRDARLWAGKLLRRDAEATGHLRLLREARARIAHPHVAAPVGSAVLGGRTLVLLPLVRGGSVADLVGDFAPLPASWVGWIVAQAADGLAAVHEAGWVHRDVTPANILLAPTGTGRPHAYLADLGLALRAEDTRFTRASAVVGTPGYVAPEVRAGADADARSDVWALAATGLEMLTGVPPPAAFAEARDLPHRSPEAALAAVLLAAADPDPARRTADAAELAARVRAIGLAAPGGAEEGPEVFEHVALPEPEPVPGPRPARPPGAATGPLLVLFGVALIVVATALLAVAL
ncbi:serine/threonine-protein kinase [Nocardioides zeae]|uniref:non-specific serine/threonine protein kinase n=1 Tax=Nocardioides imazamoxiresistens TaxID=3231893 RepID=A0ABU3Q189_9ACTN|nr:serine/threonine-protein kinase [Nocardioides zeae]MDT9595278.1 serine/threonine-protein kinase [Nocardioides zeae]